MFNKWLPSFFFANFTAAKDEEYFKELSFSAAGTYLILSDPIYQGGGNYAHQMSNFWHFCVLCHVNFQKLLNLFYSSKTANFHNFTFSNKLNFFPIAICISLSLRLLKVGKSQKHFFLKLHCPKNKQNIRKQILP